MPRILPIKAMVITSASPATKVGRVGCSPWSIFGRYHPRWLINFRPASTLQASIGNAQPPSAVLHRSRCRPGARNYLHQRVAHPHRTTRFVLPERSHRSNRKSLPIRSAQTSAVDPTMSAALTGPAEIAGPSASTRPGWNEPSSSPALSCLAHVEPRIHPPSPHPDAPDPPPEAAWPAPVRKVRIDQCHPQCSRADQPAQTQRHRRVPTVRFRPFQRNRSLCDSSQLERRRTGPARSTFHLSATSGRSERSAGHNVIDF